MTVTMTATGAFFRARTVGVQPWNLDLLEMTCLAFQQSFK